MSAKEMFEKIGYEKTDLLKGKSVNYENKKYETVYYEEEKPIGDVLKKMKELEKGNSNE